MSKQVISKVLLLISAVVGLIAVILAIVGVATRNWISVQGNTNELRAKFSVLLDENGPFVAAASAPLTTFGIPLPAAKQVVINIANATLIQVDGQLSRNLQSTTYSLFDKKIAGESIKIPEFELLQGLVIAGLICLFIGTVLATIMLSIHGGLRFVSLFAIVPLCFLVLGSILILLGYLLFTKILTEDFGHELGIKVSLGYSFVLIAISSIIGFVTAIIFGSLLISHIHRATHGIRPIKTQGTIEQSVDLKDRRGVPVVMKDAEPVTS